MNTPKSFFRWYAILSYMGILALTMSCAAIFGPSTTVQGILQLEDGIIQVQDENGDLEPLAGTSTFEMVGTLESLDPLKVGGRDLQRNEATEIAEGLQTGDLVRVRGAVLEDDHWLAYSVEPAEAGAQDQTLTLIGTVESIDPWVVNGITLNVTPETVINGEVTTGMLVKVEILLLEDGTWEVISITPLGDLIPTDGCVTVIATIESIDGDQIQFLGWPVAVSVGDVDSGNENNNEANDNDANENEDNANDNEGGDVDLTTLEPGQQVLAVICVSADGQLVIVQITILDVDDDGAAGGEKVLICHKPDKKGGHTISVASPAVPAHLGHGDKLGACP